MNRPITYALIGSGCLAKHFAFYFHSEGLLFKKWARKPLLEFNSLPIKTHFSPTQRLKACLRSVSHVLLLISDDSLPLFLKKYPFLYEKTLIHCSGLSSFSRLQSLHPLMTFTSSLYEKAFYPKIPFVLEKGKASFSTLFPGLKNPTYSISADLKPFYHSLCVSSGNFTSLLWAYVIEEMRKHLSLPKRALQPYMEAIFLNLKKDHKFALSGPLVRKEEKMIHQHLLTLKGRGGALEGVYRNFLKLYEEVKKSKKI